MIPLKFQPVFQTRIWGGQRLRKVLAKSPPANLDGQPVGESWELADLPAGTVKADSAGAAADGSLSSLIANGPLKGKTLAEAIRLHGAAITGSAPLNHGRFPLLIKFLDAQQDLSVQVHPDAAYVAKHPEAHLKSESWYILHADHGAKVYKGVKPGVTREVFRAALEKGEVEPLLNAIPVKAGDCHYLASGTVHALGAGILAAEVQTPSDTTFRVFDWNRLGPDGKARALHVEQAMDVIDFAPVRPTVALAAGRLVECEFFTLDRRSVASGQEIAIAGGEPLVWIITSGQGVITCDDGGPTAFTKGDTLLIPAAIKNPKLRPVADTAWLEAAIPTPANAM